VTRLRVLLVVALLGGLVAHQAPTLSQTLGRVTSPAQEFGANVGDDYFLATYRQLEQYWKKLTAESDRVRLGVDWSDREGRPQWMAIVSAPENLARLDEYRTISRRLALGEGDEPSARDAGFLGQGSGLD
jgi:hypothetical protein